MVRLLRVSEIECRVGKVCENGVSLLLYKDARAGIYESCNKIRFYECLHEYFQYTEKVEPEFVQEVKMRDDLMGELYAYYLKTEYLSIEIWKEIEELLRCYAAV